MGPAVEAQAQKAVDAEQKQQQQQQCYMEKGVMLEPFLHQVGGHCCVLRLGEQTICKPLIPREHQFYKSVPAAMRKFTPQYRGNANYPSFSNRCCVMLCCCSSLFLYFTALCAYVKVRWGDDALQVVC